MTDTGTLATIASIVAALGTLILSFRIQREQQDERTGTPWADRLLVGAALSSLLLVVLPLVALPHPWPWAAALERAGCAAGVIMLIGYIFAKQAGPRNNPETAERLAAWITLVVAAVVFVSVFLAIYGRLNETSL